MNMKPVLYFFLILIIDSTIIDAQTTWTKDPANPVLGLGSNGSWDDGGALLPTVILDSGGFKMWYHGSDGSITRIGYATSNDGATWSKSGSNPNLDLGPSGSWDDVSLLEPSVLFDGST